MNVERTHSGHETRYAASNDSGLQYVVVFDAGEDNGGPAIWKVLLPGRDGTEDLYRAEQFRSPDADQLAAWLTPVTGHDAAGELAAAVDRDPPPAAGWQHTEHG
jgi:hypothetical protein